MQTRPKTRQTAHFCRLVLTLLLFLSAISAHPQPASHRVTVTVVDENSLPVAGASVTVSSPSLHLQTDYAGRCTFTWPGTARYQLRVDKPGFYQAVVSAPDVHADAIEITLAHEQIVLQQVTVTASHPGIDSEQTSDTKLLSLPEIINIPYPTSRDIRNTREIRARAHPRELREYRGRIPECRGSRVKAAGLPRARARGATAARWPRRRPRTPPWPGRA